MLGGGTLTLKFNSPSFAELAWHVRNRCVHCLIVVPSFLANLLGTLVVIKARRRCEDMVRVSCPIHHFLPRGNKFMKFGAVLIALLASTILVSILGVQYTMRVFPFWSPGQFSEYPFPFLGSLVFPKV